MYHVIARGNEQKKVFLGKKDYGAISRLIERGKDLHENLAVHK